MQCISLQGISGEQFAQAVCSAPTMAYLEKAQSFRWKV